MCLGGIWTSRKSISRKDWTSCSSLGSWAPSRSNCMLLVLRMFLVNDAPSLRGYDIMDLRPEEGLSSLIGGSWKWDSIGGWIVLVLLVFFWGVVVVVVLLLLEEASPRSPSSPPLDMTTLLSLLSFELCICVASNRNKLQLSLINCWIRFLQRLLMRYLCTYISCSAKRKKRRS